MAGLHRDIAAGQIHVPHQWEYADATARGAASGFVATDVGKLARQLDDNTLWMLTDDSPVTWLQLTGSGSGAYTNEEAQDAVGGILADSSSINFTYTDATPEITAAAIFGTTAGTVAEGNHGHTVTVALNFVIDGGGSAVSTGLKGFVRVPFAWSNIAKASLLADQNTNAVVDVWKDTLANHPPTDADSITASAPLTLSAADSVEDATLTGWTKTGSAGDVLAFNVDSNSAALLLTVALDLVRAL